MHRFLKPEPAGIFHVHRWLYMRSFVLWGNYTEERLFADRTTRKIRHRWLSTFSMTKDVVHRIDQWNSAWTWCFVKSDTGLWGYLDSDLKYTPWDEYIPQDKRVGQI